MLVILMTLLFISSFIVMSSHIENSPIKNPAEAGFVKLSIVSSDVVKEVILCS
ncbi:hypothetical protein BvCmsB1661_04859 [Escherichia coli]|nr:hypothetical protein BvCmsB1661_04859 [Escherichia coli]CTZ98580.1 Uncharacterised protein [Escherichia coli]